MQRTPHIFLPALVAIALACFGAGTAAASDGAAETRVATATPAGAAPAGTNNCKSLAARKARAAAKQAKSPAAARRTADRVRAKVQRRCQLRNRKRAKVSVLPTLVSGPLTIAVDGGYSGWSDTEVQERAALGAAVTRHEWDPAEPVDEQDDVVEVAAGTIHTRLHALLGGNQLGDPARYRDFVVAFVQRYGIGGSFWAEHPELDASRFAITTIELGNEPYFGEMSPELYADTVRPTLETIRALNLPVFVVLPSRVYGQNTSWMDTLYERIPNLNAFFGAFADHPYWYGHDPAEGTAAGPFARVETLRKRMNELGANTKPIYITEYGESTASCGEECVDEATQAAHLQQMIEAVVGRPDWGVKMLSLFQLRDRGTASGDRELQFGMLRQDGSPKPSYGIVRGAMQQYRG
jgi:Glycosyl hydrolase catalytic core